MKEKITVAQIRLTDNGGMSYAIRLGDGSFIMIDGGESDKDGSGSYSQNSRVLINYLKRHSREDIPRIACWFITHFHLDHVDLATDFLKEYAGQIKVDRFAYNHPGTYDYLRDDDRWQEWQQAMDLYPGAERHQLCVGEVLHFDGAEVQVYLAEGARVPNEPESQNNISAAMRIKFDTGRAFMVLGDCCTVRLAALCDTDSPYCRTEDELKCDILQAAHHGLVMGPVEYIRKNRVLYEMMSPSITFFPTHPDRFTSHRCFIEEKYTDNAYLMEHTKYYHHRQTTVVDMDNLAVTVEDTEV